MHLPVWIWVAAGVAFVAWAFRQYQAWQAAGEASLMYAEEQRALRALHAQLLQHPCWRELWSALAARGVPVSLDGQGGTHRLGILTLFTDHGHAHIDSDPGIRGLRAWLTQGDRKLVASLTFATGHVEVRDVKFLEWPS